MREHGAGGKNFDEIYALVGKLAHALANLEDHHFKFPQHRIPGDIHVHFFGTSKLSYRQRAWEYRTGDVVEVSFEGLGMPLRNPVVRHEPADTPVRVEAG